MGSFPETYNDPHNYYQCVVLENIHTPLQKGLEIPGMGGGNSQRPKNLSKYMKLDWNFQRGGGGGGSKEKFLLWRRYG